jgi:hypothetical protein
MFKVSHNCKVPHVNIDNLRDELYQVGAVPSVIECLGNAMNRRFL